MTVADRVRFLLTILGLLGLGIWAEWTWFWAALALCMFNEGWGLGYKFLERK